MAGIEAAGSFVLGDHSHDINLVKQNALKLARIAKAAGLPTVLTSSMEDRIQGPLVPEIAEILPEEFAARIKRPGIVNAMHHDGFNKAVKATGRKKLFVAGITTEIILLIFGHGGAADKKNPAKRAGQVRLER